MRKCVENKGKKKMKLHYIVILMYIVRSKKDKKNAKM